MADELKRVGLKLTAEGAVDFKQTLSQCSDEMRRLQSELKASQGAYDKNTTAAKKLQDRQKYLQGATETYADKVSILKRELEELKNAENRDEDAIKKKEKQLQSAQRSLNKYKNQLADCEEQLRKHNVALEEMAQKLKTAGDAMDKAGSKLTKGVTAPILTAGTAAAGLAMNFEDSMAKVSTIADTTEVPLDQLEQSIKDLSNETGISASEIAENVYSAISAGRSTGEAVAFVGESAKLAKAGFTDSAASLDVLTTIMNAYGKSADEVGNISDVLINTQNLGKTTVNELASSMGSVIPTASAFGVSLEQLASAYVVMTKNGISTAESTTYISGMLNELGKSGTTASDILKEKTGKSFTELMESGASLSDVLAIVQEAADAGGLSMADMFGNIRAGKAALTLTNDGGLEFSETLQSMGQVAGATDAAFEKVAGTTSTKLRKAFNRVKTSGIELGESILDTAMPAIDSLAQTVESVTDTFNGLSDEEKEQVVKIGAIVAAVGPVLSITGKITKGVGSLTGGLAALTVKLGLNTAASTADAAASTADATAKGVQATATETATAAQTGLNLAMLASPAGQLAAVIGILAAGAIAFSAAARDGSADTAAYSSRMKDLKDSIEDAKDANEGLLASLTQQSTDVQYTGSVLQKWKEKLGEVVDAEGKVKEGCEATAEYILGELNDAMGTSYTVTADGFIANSEGAAQSLEDINKAIETNIGLMKRQAIQQAVSSQYAEAMQNAASANSVAESAANEYAAALERLAEAERTYNEERSKEGDRKNKGAYGPGSSGELIAATQAWVEAKQQVSETAGALNEAAGAAAEAQATLDGLDSVMDSLAEGTPDSIGAAADAFARIPSAAQEAGSTAGSTFAQQYAAALQAQQNAVDTNARLMATGMVGAMNDQLANSPIMAPLMQDPDYAAVMQTEIEAMKAETQGATLPAPDMAEADYARQVKTDVKEMDGVTSGATLDPPDMSDPDYTAQAQTGVTGMNSVTKSSKVTAPGMKTPSWTGAAQQGRAAMQSYLSNHPLTVYANVKSNVSSVTAGHNAQGNIIEDETLTWVAEGGKAEAIIPLEGDRARAIKLYRETGKRLGLISDGSADSTQTGRAPAASAADLAPLIRAVERCAELLESGSVIQMDGDTVAGKLLPSLSRKMGVLARR